MNDGDVRAGFVTAGMPAELADEVLQGYGEAKRRYYLGDYRPTEVEGGRFCEAVTRVVEHELFAGKYTPLGKALPPRDEKRLQSFAQAQHAYESVRRHIPKALYLVYGIRNTRDAAHLGDGIDPNIQDATLVVGTMDWMMAELVRIFQTVSADEAHAIITDLATRDVPVVEEIDGQPVVSKDLGVADLVVVFLYRAGRDKGLDLPTLKRQMRHNNLGNLKQSVRRLDDKGLVLLQPETGRAHITTKGIAYVDDRKLLQPAQTVGG